MSAQGTTLRRGTALVPMWPLAVLVAGAAAIVLAVSLFDSRPATPTATVSLVERFANSGAIPAASTNEAGGTATFGPVTLVERSANSGVIPAASVEGSGGATTNPCPEACQLARRG
jgi:hypothetical protein